MHHQTCHVITSIPVQCFLLPLHRLNITFTTFVLLQRREIAAATISLHHFAIILPSSYPLFLYLCHRNTVVSPLTHIGTALFLML